MEDAAAAAIVDVANASYQTMLRLIGYSYACPGPDPEKSLAVDLGHRSDEGADAARRKRGAASGGAVQSRLQCWRLVHRAARFRAVAAHGEFATLLRRARGRVGAGRGEAGPDRSARRARQRPVARAGGACERFEALTEAPRQAAAPQRSPPPRRAPTQSVDGVRDRRRRENANPLRNASSASIRASASPARRRCFSPMWRGLGFIPTTWTSKNWRRSRANALPARSNICARMARRTKRRRLSI